MRTALRFCAVLCGAILVAATLRQDVVAQPKLDLVEDEPTPSAEPVGGTGTPGIKDPFTPYDVGPPESIWPYESMTPAEQAVIDHERGANGWRQIHDAYAEAVVERSQQARGEAAQHALGVDNTAQIGVVP